MTGDTDRFRAARAVADAVLFEGYLLYPYRRSATKNQLRWQFGVLVPPAASAADPSERSSVRTEVVVDPGQRPVLHARIRFLQVQRRTGEEPAWDEAVEREVGLDPVPLLPVAGVSRAIDFHIDGGEDRDGAVTRLRCPIDGTVHVDAAWADGGGAMVAVAVSVENTTAWERQEDASRDDAVRHSLVAVHTLLAVDDAELLSVLDPPDHALDAVKACHSDGTFPVLVGDGDTPDVVLSSPIILYDHPVIAPESQGDLFDSTEIDEILALRVLTLTEDEKIEARATDPRAAAIVDRVDQFSPDVWSSLHGTMREIRPAGPTASSQEELPWWEPAVDEAYDPYADTLTISGTEVSKGSAVILHPSRRADAHDMFLAGQRATVAGIFTDVDDSVLVQVTVDDDPATEVLAWQRRGLFFHPDELEVVR